MKHGVEAMNIGFVTNKRAPYRTLQMEEISKNPELKLHFYYTDRDILGRKWIVEDMKGVTETRLKGIRLFKQYGNINLGLLKVVRSNELLILGGYEQPTYILLSLLARLFRKPYMILFDGVSPHKIAKRDNPFKYALKKLVISGATTIFGNGQVSKHYFHRKFRVPESKIYNQFLTVDVESIRRLCEGKETLRAYYRKQLNIAADKKVLIYSGRLIARKQVDDILRAMSRLPDKADYELLILGDGPERERLVGLAKELGVELKLTGFIAQQEELFRHYFAGDCLLLVSQDEPWGLVVNEAMAAELPIIVSDEVGAGPDLVVEGTNGYVIRARDVNALTEKIEALFASPEIGAFGRASADIIKDWTFVSSNRSFMRMISDFRNQ